MQAGQFLADSFFGYERATFYLDRAGFSTNQKRLGKDFERGISQSRKALHASAVEWF